MVILLFSYFANSVQKWKVKFKIKKRPELAYVTLHVDNNMLPANQGFSAITVLAGNSMEKGAQSWFWLWGSYPTIAR